MAPFASDIAATGWTLLTQAASTSFDVLFSGFAPDLTTTAGLLGYAVAAIAAIAWLTAAPAPRRPQADRRQMTGQAPRAVAAIG
jgi:hypothetical protein